MENLKRLINDKLKSIDKTELVQKMGYHNVHKGLETLDNFLNCKNILTFLDGSGKYDFIDSPGAFLKKLCEVLEINEELVEKEIDRINKIIKEKDFYKDAYIYVKTNFVRQNQPIFVLAAMQGHLRIKQNIDKLLFKSDEYVLEVVSKAVREHYKNNDGKLPMWSKIVNYAYHHKDSKVMYLIRKVI